MALTIEQLSDLVESLQAKVATLETTIKQYRQDISGLEQQLSESIKTDKLVVTGEAEISGRSILADRERLAELEVSLQAHDKSIDTNNKLLAIHDTKLGEQHDDFDRRLKLQGASIEGHEGRLTEAQGYIGAHQTRLDEFSKYFSQSIAIPGDIQFGASLKTVGRMHLEGGERLYLLNKDGVVISTYSGGNGNLTIEGDLVVNGNISYAGSISDSNPPAPAPPPPSRWTDPGAV
jgi:hypothetical protein